MESQRTTLGAEAKQVVMVQEQGRGGGEKKRKMGERQGATNRP